MKYDVLASYKQYLLNDACLSHETARTYYNRLDNLLENENTEKFDIDKLIDKLATIKYKNHFSQSKNALLYFLAFKNMTLDNEQKEKIEKLQKNTKKKYRKRTEADFKQINDKIKHIRNQKLKLSYEVIIETALRVSELAQIRKKDCELTEDTLTLNFVGKGGNKEDIVLHRVDNVKLFDNLKNLIDSLEDTRKVFYCATYLQKKAKELKFKCHDLRRASAKIEYKKSKSKNNVKEKLRHKSMKTTNLYLRSKVKI